MEDRIRFVEHRGKQILLADLSHCLPREVEKIALLVPSYVTSEPHGSVLLLADFTGAAFDRIAIERLKESAVFDRPHLKRSAWVGIEKLPKVFYEHIKNFSQRDLPAFATREEAMDWLVSNEELQSSDRTLGDLPKRRPPPSSRT
jgi:SpoIIAA-like